MTASSHLSAVSATADTFSRTIRALQRLQALGERVADAQAEELRELRKLLIARTALHKELFGSLLANYDHNFRDINPLRDGLKGWALEGGVFVAEFANSYRGEQHCYRLPVPIRYLLNGGEAVMRNEAEALFQKALEKTQQRQAEDSAAERCKLQELMRKYPDVAGAAGGAL